MIMKMLEMKDILSPGFYKCVVGTVKAIGCKNQIAFQDFEVLSRAY
jgi:hypothetical protein